MIKNIYKNVNVPIVRINVNFYLNELGALEQFMGKKTHM